MEGEGVTIEAPATEADVAIAREETAQAEIAAVVELARVDAEQEVAEAVIETAAEAEATDTEDEAAWHAAAGAALTEIRQCVETNRDCLARVESSIQALSDRLTQALAAMTTTLPSQGSTSETSPGDASGGRTESRDSGEQPAPAAPEGLRRRRPRV